MALLRRSEIDDVECLSTKIESKAPRLFKEKNGKVPLIVRRVFRRAGDEAKEEVQDREVWGVADLKGLKNESDPSSQFFIIQQDRSWTSLNISRSMFECLMSTYSIFPQFWKCMFTFGPKITENEFEFPQFRSRQHRTAIFKESECAYMLRRVELNGRNPDEHGSKAWSIRQTGVYHKFGERPSCPAFPGELYFAENIKSLFLLVAPSKNVDAMIGRSIEASIDDELTVSPWNIQRLLVVDSLRGWNDYMACLEKELKTQSDRIVCADVGSNKENLSPLTNFQISFIDRQKLKIVEDKVIDLQVILPTLLETIKRLQHYINSYPSMEFLEAAEYDLVSTKDEFEAFVREAEMQVERARVLKERSKSTAKLLSDLLTYEEAVALKDLAKESHQESKDMHRLTERSTKDSAAMKILTIITLIYLPTTIVANFFSTQFVQKNDSGNMYVAGNVWLLAAISIPLTLFTIMLWWSWVYFTRIGSTAVQEDTLPNILRRRQSSFKSILSKRKKKMLPDEEAGLGVNSTPSPSVTFREPSSFHDSAKTWSSAATTVKSG